MPGSRQIALDKYGVDPWSRDPDQAVHAAALHLRGLINGSKGLEGYNPGMPTYPQYILGQKVGNVRGRSSGGSSQQPYGSQTTTKTVTTPGTDNSALRRQLVGEFLQSGGVANPNAVLALAGSYGQAADIPGTSKTTTTRVKGKRSTSSRTLGSGRYPTGKRGDIIGTPYSGTHSLGNWQSDNAVDIAVPAGTPMVALQDGVVVKVTKHPQGAGRFAGDQVTVRGRNGNEYFYAHGVARVKAGQRVRKGQSLGTTGSANGVEHLHYAQMRGDPRQHTK
jgi:murein DD-endopeptidase MepM/ murein hydrolase activator NlpD